MSADRRAAQNGHVLSTVKRAGGRSELEAMRATCRRQATMIDTLGHAVSAFRGGVSALQAENAELRAENHRMRRGRHIADDGRHAEANFAPDVQAPATARWIVMRELRDRVTAPVLERALLVASELTTNSVRHSGAATDTQLVFRVELSTRMVRLELQDPGHDGTIARRPGDADDGGGYGLNIVQTLSERWGLERVAAGGTRVWAQLALDA